MNPILLSPKIESDKSVPEQLAQMKSYLHQFKEQVELILMNIDSDNITEKYEAEVFEGFSKRLAGTDTISQITQTAGLIKLSVKDLEDSEASLIVTVNGIMAEVYDGQGNSRITQNANAISSEVTRATGAEGGLSSRITQTADAITAEVTRATGAEGGLSGRIAVLPATVTISTTAGSDGKSATLTISSTPEGGGSVVTSADTIAFNGLVSFTDLSTSGSTIINGGNITTGTIDASVVSVTNLNASNISSGTLSANRIAANSIAVSKLTGTITNGGWGIDLTNGTMSIGSLAVGSITGSILDNGWGVDFDHGTMTIGNLSANNITTGTLSADRIAANSLAVAKLTGSITDSGNTWELNLTNGTFTVGDISANKITSGTIDASTITVSNINGSNITSGTINASYISISGKNISDLTNDAGYCDSYDTTTIIGNTVTTGYVNALGISANSISVGSDTFYANASSGVCEIGGFEVNDTEIKTQDAYVTSNNRGIMIKSGAQWQSGEYALYIGYSDPNYPQNAYFKVNSSGKLSVRYAEAHSIDLEYLQDALGTNDLKKIKWKKASAAVSDDDYVLTGDAS